MQAKARRNPCAAMAGATGLEPATFGVTGRRSNQLSYAPFSGIAGTYRAAPAKSRRPRRSQKPRSHGDNLSPKRKKPTFFARKSWSDHIRIV